MLLLIHSRVKKSVIIPCFFFSLPTWKACYFSRGEKERERKKRRFKNYIKKEPKRENLLLRVRWLWRKKTFGFKAVLLTDYYRVLVKRTRRERRKKERKKKKSLEGIYVYSERRSLREANTSSNRVLSVDPAMFYGGGSARAHKWNAKI